MKTIFTLFAIACMAASNFSYSQCSVGGNGIAANKNIQVNGDMTDWASILNDPDNITNDATPDSDAPISDVGRDFTRFAFTENISTLFLYFQRAGSVNNSVDIIFYVDVNNNGMMQTNEPVVAISWSGANGNAQIDIYNYMQIAAEGDPVSGDGSDMPGSLSLRVKLGNLGKGSTNGISVEVGIPFTDLYKMGATSNIDSLSPLDQFRFHVSSINGSVSSVPGSNSVNDNFGGCFSGFIVLPVKLVYLEGHTLKNTVALNWQIADNENAAAFEIEESSNGKNYKKLGTLNATIKRGSETYSFSTTLKYTKNYYRLKIIDKDKLAEYSKTIVLTSKNAGEPITVEINNPVYNDLVIKYQAVNEGSSVVTIYNSIGAKVYSKKEIFAKGSNTITIPNQYLRTRGVYLVDLTNQYNERITQKALKL